MSWTFPTSRSNGSAGRVELQIGWHSETVVISGAEASEQTFGEEPFEVDTILALQEKTRALNAQPRRPHRSRCTRIRLGPPSPTGMR